MAVENPSPNDLDRENPISSNTIDLPSATESKSDRSMENESDVPKSESSTVVVTKKSGPSIARLTPKVVTSQVTIPTRDSISDQDSPEALHPIEKPYIARRANEGESVVSLENSAKIFETTSPSTTELNKGRLSERETMSAERLLTMPTAEIALLTLEKLEPAQSDSRSSSDAGKSSSLEAGRVYSLSDHSIQVSEPMEESVPTSDWMAKPIQDAVSSSLGNSNLPEPGSTVPNATSVGIAKVELAVGERRSLRLAVPIANSDVADQKVCLVHKANAHELVLQPMAAGLTSVTIWFRNL